jgi:ribose transport system substrate-binding protein
VPALTYAVQRYGGVKKVLDEAGISSEIVDCGTESSASLLSRMTAYLEGHPETDFTCPIGSWVATLATTALQEMNMLGKVRNGGFDVGKKVLDDIKKGKTVFAVDQQGYAQSFYTVVALYNLVKNGIQAFDYNTGMAIINADNVDKFLEYQKLRSGK